MQSIITISAVGDISFMGIKRDKPYSKIFENIRTVLQKADLTVGNLESPLVINGKAVPGKCILRGHPDWAFILKDAGFDIVSLANNHIMDFGEKGLFSTIEALDKAGIKHVGAGRNIEEAAQPIFVNVKGRRICFLARTSVTVSSPSHASEQKAGVAFFDLNETKRHIQMCKKTGDIIIVMLHWGLENYLYPSPEQRKTAKELMDEGVSLIMGHHPHVLQGIEKVNDGAVAYSLGNFVFDEFDWILNTESPGSKCLKIGLTSENRKGIVLNTDFNENNKIILRNYCTSFTHDSKVVHDSSFNRKNELDNRSNRLNLTFYNFWWRLYSLRCEWTLRLNSKLSLRKNFPKILKLRPKHLKEIFALIKKSADITSGKSTNPFD